MAHPCRTAPESRIGQELNAKWTLVRVLGVGGASAVYEAVHRNGRRAALKVMWRKTIRARPSAELAAHEALLANAVGHPGVVEVLDNDVAEDGSAYLVMELLEGQTLEQRRRDRGGRIAFDEALPLFEQLLDVLAVAHDHGIVHRDLKPDNVFITAQGRVKVLDFGLAARPGDDEDDVPWFGTPGFMAPEQARGEWAHVDAVSDLWAVGATFYTALTGRLVHHKKTPAALVLAAASEEVDLTSIDLVAPLQVSDVLQRALAKDKTDRWPNARALLAALRMATTAARASWRPPHVLPPVPPLRRCTSTTRVFLRRSNGESKGGCGLTCLMCPVCPQDVATLRRAT